MAYFGSTRKALFLLLCTVSVGVVTLLGIVLTVPTCFGAHCTTRKDAAHTKLDITANHAKGQITTLNSTTAERDKSERAHTVLLWTGTKYFWMPRLNQPDFLKSIHCKYTNCRFTTERRRVRESSALLFHGRNINDTKELPAFRSPDQYYVFYHRDRPIVINSDLSEFEGVFNLTMTFRQDSDAPVAYGKTVPQTEEGRRHVEVLRSRAKFLKGKDERLPVAWMASHCPAENRREEYVQELQKHIRVDVYGKCGNYTCPKDNHYGCYRNIENKYKFYLAFENNFCRDYATEKVFTTLGYFVVPVVMGSANYSALLPPHSVINVQDFDSPKHLADYLKSLDQDPVKYRAYFDWKDKYQVKSVWQTVPLGFCKLCEILNTLKPRNKVYKDIAHWHFGHCYNETIDKLLNKPKIKR